MEEMEAEARWIRKNTFLILVTKPWDTSSKTDKKQDSSGKRNVELAKKSTIFQNKFKILLSLSNAWKR